MRQLFTTLALAISEWVGRPFAFLGSLAVVVVWLILGPAFAFSDTWLMGFNTGITIVTFLMVFLIQSAQSRNSKALHLKLNELLRGVEGTRTGLVNLEQRTDQELQKLDHEFAQVAERARNTEGRREEAGTAHRDTHQADNSQAWG